MFPDLSYIIHYFVGLGPDNAFSVVKTFGLFLAIAILSAAALLHRELKRKASQGLFKPIRETVTTGLPPSGGEIFSNALIGFVAGFKLVLVASNWSLFASDPSGLIFSGQGSLPGGIIGAFVLAGLRYYEKKKAQLPKPKITNLKIYPHDRIGDITVIAAVSGVAGAKLFAILEDLPAFFRDPVGTFFSGSGLAIYGGLIVAFTVCYFYLKAKKIEPIHVMDAVAPALIIAYGIGRLGCQFSGDGDWGIVNELHPPSWWLFPDWLWAYQYPSNVLNEGILIDGCDPEKWNALQATPMSIEQRCQEACGIRYCHQLAQPVFPTPVYETLMAFGIGAFLWSIRKRIQIPGLLFFIYLVFNGLERMLIERIRVNIRYEFMGLHPTQAEIIGTAIIVTGIAGIAYLLFTNNKKQA